MLPESEQKDSFELKKMNTINMELEFTEITEKKRRAISFEDDLVDEIG